MRNKYIIINKAEAEKWFAIANMLAKSFCKHELALQQFNRLNACNRIKIKKCFDACDVIRRKKIPEGEQDEAWIGVMVDAHIIATEFDIDPLTAVLCLKPPCRPTEHIVVRE